MPTFVYMTRCDGCGHCVDICPSDIMHIDTTYRRAYNIEPNMCWECYSWKIKFRDGREKEFVSPIRTTPWGSIKGPAEYEAPSPEALNDQELAHEPGALKILGGLPALTKDQFKVGVV